MGAALADAFASAREVYAVIYRFARTFPAPHQIDITDEASVAAAADTVREGSPPRLIIVATGLLHADGHHPERRLADIDPAWMARNFAVNTIGPALIAKYFLPLLPRRGRTVFAMLSARVGSIGDNRSGGWQRRRGGVSSCHWAKPWPVARNTSQARCTRAPFCPSIRASVAASSSARRAAKPSPPPAICCARSAR